MNEPGQKGGRPEVTSGTRHAAAGLAEPCVCSQPPVVGRREALFREHE